MNPVVENLAVFGSSESPLSYTINGLQLMHKKHFPPEGFLVAFLTGLFSSGFHVS